MGDLQSKSETGNSAPLIIDIVSDVMCPWCFIGQKNIEAARKLVPELDLEIHWRPYQLDASLPPEGKDRQTYLNEKFGGKDQADTIYHRIKQAGAENDIQFRFDLIKVSPNTLDAHRLIRRADRIGADIQDQLVQRLFEQYFLEGKNIGDRKVLKEAAKSVGILPTIVDDLFASDDDKGEVEQEIAHARTIGVSGVPFFIIAQKYSLSGAQPAEVLANALRQISQEITNPKISD